MVVSASAEIDSSYAARLQAALVAPESGGSTVVVDMSQTVFCDSAGIRELVQAQTRARADGGQVRLVVTSDDAVLRVFALTGVDELFQIFSSLPAALTDAT